MGKKIMSAFVAGCYALVGYHLFGVTGASVGGAIGAYLGFGVSF